MLCAEQRSAGALGSLLYLWRIQSELTATFYHVNQTLPSSLFSLCKISSHVLLKYLFASKLSGLTLILSWLECIFFRGMMLI